MYTVYLPGNVRFQDVVNVVGKLLGNQWEWKGPNQQLKYFEVKNVKINKENPPIFPESALITVEQECACKNAPTHFFPMAYFYYHFESEDGNSRILQLSTYHQSWLLSHKNLSFKLTRMVCDFFGGEVYLATNADGKPLYTVPRKSKEDNCDNWIKRMERIVALKPIMKYGATHK